MTDEKRDKEKERAALRHLRAEVYRHARDLGKVARWFATPKNFLRGHSPNEMIRVFGAQQVLEVLSSSDGQLRLRATLMSLDTPKTRLEKELPGVKHVYPEGDKDDYFDKLLGISATKNKRTPDDR